jgi:hypothetical protein
VTYYSKNHHLKCLLHKFSWDVQKHPGEKNWGRRSSELKRHRLRRATGQQPPSRVALRQLDRGPRWRTRGEWTAVELQRVKQSATRMAVSWGRQQLGRWETDPATRRSGWPGDSVTGSDWVCVSVCCILVFHFEC